MYKRILLKLSGESLMGTQQYGIDPQRLADYAQQIQNIAQTGVQVAIVIGGGNIFRGLSGAQKGFDRVKGDQMGMLATVINSLALCSALEAIGQRARVLTSVRMEPVGELYSTDKAIRLLNKGNIVIIAGGTGNPYFTTDTASVVRALEVNCDAVLKATKVDGIYSADPFKDPTAVRYEEISFDEAIEKRLQVMDASAFSLCRDNNLAIIVFDFAAEDSLERVVSGDTSCGTIVS